MHRRYRPIVLLSGIVTSLAAGMWLGEPPELLAQGYGAAGVPPVPTMSTPPWTRSYAAVPSPPSAPAPVSRGDLWPELRVQRARSYNSLSEFGSGSPTKPLPRPPAQKPQAPRTATRQGPAPPPGQQPPLTHQPPGAAAIEPAEHAQIVARVGSEVILLGDVVPGIAEIRSANAGRISDEQFEAELRKLLEKRLPTYVETMLVYHDALRTIPKENFPQLEKNIEEYFEKDEIDRLMKQLDVDSRRALEEKFRQMGTSIDRQRRAFVRRTLAQQWIREQVKRDEEITFDRMLGYYHQQIEDFRHPARARWEQLTVRFASHPTKAQARAAIARLGNQILDGQPFPEVARQHSEGFTAEDGGVHDWTTEGSLVCEKLDRALFGLPPGQLSPIIEGPNGFHIIRVREREEAGVTPFVEAQVEIREKIRRRRGNDELKAYLERLKAEVPVWTVLDEPA